MLWKLLVRYFSLWKLLLIELIMYYLFFSLCKLLVWLSFRKDIDSRALILARCFKSVFSEGFFRLKKKTHPNITKIINVNHEGERGRVKEYTIWDCFHPLG